MTLAFLIMKTGVATLANKAAEALMVEALLPLLLTAGYHGSRFRHFCS
jgi:hypothetical protein